MNFQTSCMVLVTNEQQQIKLQKWMVDIGWRVLGGRDSKHCFLVADTDENAALWMELDESARKYFGDDFYDCGDNIELFKALAAMNSDNDREQWFVAHCWIRFAKSKSGVTTESGALEIISGHWFKVRIPSRNYIMAKWQKYATLPMIHKATAEEIIEHFKK